MSLSPSWTLRLILRSFNRKSGMRKAGTQRGVSRSAGLQLRFLAMAFSSSVFGRCFVLAQRELRAKVDVACIYTLELDKTKRCCFYMHCDLGAPSASWCFLVSAFLCFCFLALHLSWFQCEFLRAKQESCICDFKSLETNRNHCSMFQTSVHDNNQNAHNRAYPKKMRNVEKSVRITQAKGSGSSCRLWTGC